MGAEVAATELVATEGAKTAGEAALSDAATTAAMQSAASTATSAVLQKALAPSAPEVKPTLGMPDPLAQEAARRREIAETVARRGRASTIMTQPSDKLGG